MRNDEALHLMRVTKAIVDGPSNAGNRKDKKICTARAGECRNNRKYYSSGMHNAKSWSMPRSDDSCPKHCPYLR